MRQANGHPNGHAKSNGAIKRAEQTRGDAEAETDRTRWRMKDDRGTQTWHYLESDEEVKAWPQSTPDKWYLGMDTVCPRLCTCIYCAST
jgi:lanosterol synthase